MNFYTHPPDAPHFARNRTVCRLGRREQESFYRFVVGRMWLDKVDFKTICELVGVAEKTLKSYIRGHQNPTKEVVERLAMLFEVPIEDLFKEDPRFVHITPFATIFLKGKRSARLSAEIEKAKLGDKAETVKEEPKKAKIAAFEVPETDLMKKILDLLHENGPMGPAVIAEKLGMSRAIYQGLNQLLITKRIEKVKEGIRVTYQIAGQKAPPAAEKPVETQHADPTEAFILSSLLQFYGFEKQSRDQVVLKNLGAFLLAGAELLKNFSSCNETEIIEKFIQHGRRAYGG